MSSSFSRLLSRFTGPSPAERNISAVPGAVIAFFALMLALQVASGLWRAAPAAGAEDLPPPPSEAVLRLASFGDAVPTARLLMLYVQAFDLRADNRVRYRDLDYTKLAAWLDRILALDPAGQYPLHAALRIYAEVPDERKVRSMLDFAYREFPADPNRRWRWLAEAAVLAQHTLHDLPLAEQYAAAIEHSATGPDVPLWARQMRAFVLEDMNELEQARIMIGGFIAKGQVKDPGELRWLEQHLQEIEARIRHNDVQKAR